MEIYVEIKSSSFYVEKSTFYVSCRVIEKRVFPESHINKSNFEELKLGSLIGLKFSSGIKRQTDLTKEKLALHLLTRFIIFEIDSWEDSKPNIKHSTPRFGIANARKCDILPEK